ncbi:hypothetical protein ACIOD2_49725 [Amycolatopsis sp. NPDC088138]|uniref:hypothetical protein n=1 Tax=Amycolatopsis sp. NPDC088138 TaxID=3363938 RepID=UPI003816ADCC
MRFAFYSRVSTEDQQDPVASLNWQLARAKALVNAHGDIVAEFFDIRQSRSIPWNDAPKRPGSWPHCAKMSAGSTRSCSPRTCSLSDRDRTIADRFSEITTATRVSASASLAVRNSRTGP